SRRHSDARIVAHRDECDYGLAYPKFEDKRTRIRRPIDASDPQPTCKVEFLQRTLPQSARRLFLYWWPELKAGLSARGSDQPSRVDHTARRRGGRVAARGAGAAAGDAGDRLSQRPFADQLSVLSDGISGRSRGRGLCRGPQRSDRVPLGGESI